MLEGGMAHVGGRGRRREGLVVTGPRFVEGGITLCVYSRCVSVGREHRAVRRELERGIVRHGIEEKRKAEEAAERKLRQDAELRKQLHDAMMELEIVESKLNTEAEMPRSSRSAEKSASRHSQMPDADVQLASHNLVTQHGSTTIDEEMETSKRETVQMQLALQITILQD